MKHLKLIKKISLITAISIASIVTLTYASIFIYALVRVGYENCFEYHAQCPVPGMNRLPASEVTK